MLGLVTSREFRLGFGARGIDLGLGFRVSRMQRVKGLGCYGWSVQ